MQIVLVYFMITPRNVTLGDHNVGLVINKVLLTSVAQISRKTRLAPDELSCPLWVVSGRSTCCQVNVRCGSLAVVYDSATRMAAFGGKADVQLAL